MPTTDFGSAQRQHAIGLQHPGEPLEDVDLGILIEIDQHVAAEDDVEHAEMGEVLQQIELTVLHHAADFGTDLPELAVLGEIFHQQPDRQSALHLELAEDAGLRFFQHRLRQVGGDDLGAPARQQGPGFLQAHRDRVRLLPGGGRRAPDAQGAAGGARLRQRRKHRLAQMVEWNLVAEEERLVGGHRLDHLRRQRLGVALHLGDEFGNSRQAGLARERQQPAFDQILLVGGQIEPGALFQKLTQILIV